MNLANGMANGPPAACTSLRILCGVVFSNKVKLLASCHVPEVEVVSRSDVAFGESLTVVSQRPGCIGGSLGDGRWEVEVIGGICKDIETFGLSATTAMRELEIASYTARSALAREDRLKISLYNVEVGDRLERCDDRMDCMSSACFQT